MVLQRPGNRSPRLISQADIPSFVIPAVTKRKAQHALDKENTINGGENIQRLKKTNPQMA